MVRRKLVALGERREDIDLRFYQYVLHRPIVNRRWMADVEQPHDAGQALTAQGMLEQAPEGCALRLADAGKAVPGQVEEIV